MFAFFVPVADVGVAFAEPPSRKDAEIGVGACEAGVDPGVSYQAEKARQYNPCWKKGRWSAGTHARVRSVRNG